MNTRLTTSTSPRRRGVGLAELLIAISITGMLLLGVAAATQAGIDAYQANATSNATVHRTRMVLDRGLTLLRRTDDAASGGVDHAPGPLAAGVMANFRKGMTVTDSGFIAWEPVETLVGGNTVETYREVQWSFDASAGTLSQTVDGGEAFVLLRDVKAFRVSFQPMRSSDNIRRGSTAFDQLRRATIVLTVGVPEGDSAIAPLSSETFTLSGAASPRRNIGV